jgi:hypothetical protein
MEAELQRLELLIHHTGVSKEMVAKAFLDACKNYAAKEGFELEKGCMALHRAVVPSLVEFDEAKEHIIIHDGTKFPIDTILFFTEEYLLDQEEK